MAVAYPWFALQVRGGQEFRVARALGQREVEQFLPVYRLRKRWSDRTVTAERPLFPGYIFSRFDPLNRLPILQIPSVLQVLSHEREPVAIPEAEIEQVRLLVNSTVPICPWFPVAGTKVVIERGPLAGVEGVIVRARDALRVVVAVEILRRAVAAEVDAEWLRKLD